MTPNPETFTQSLPTGFRGESNHHLAHFSTRQFDKLANILLLLIGLLKRKPIRNMEGGEFHDIVA